jgi:hypothetical protein
MDRYTRLAEQLVHARPVSEAEAIAALEWLAASQGKRLEELVQENVAPRGR